MMTYAKLHLLLMLLKIYRSKFCWEGDRYEKNASAMIRDVRFAIQNGGFYTINRMSLENWEGSR
jgi:hypothetical protein